MTLENFRVRRFRGDGDCRPLSDFAEADRERLRRLYRMLLQLLQSLRSDAPPSEKSDALTEFLRQRRQAELLELAQEIGRESLEEDTSAELAKAIHDLRGGGLTPLVGQLQLAARRGVTAQTASTAFYLTRDHLKIMRNLLTGLDDARRREDTQRKAHGTDLIVEKWHQCVLHEEGRRARMVVECQEAATIGECCLEFGALDRILYNLINNACRHTADERIRLVILPIPDRGGENIRFVCLNDVSPSDRVWLSSGEMRNLFQASTSTTGSGFGLAIVSELVSSAYGLPNGETAVSQGYVGATLFEDNFAAWFHWPRVVQA